VLVTAVVVSHFAALRTTFAPVLGAIGRDGPAALDPNGPLVFVPFIPLAALAVAANRWRGTEQEPVAVPQRAADAVIAAFFLSIAWLAAKAGPAVFDTDTLAWRADLLSLAPFTAAMVVVLFGSRMLTRLRPALWLLTLMAPALYRPVIELARQGSSYLTIETVTRLASGVPGLTIAGRVDGSYLVLGRGAERTVVAVTSACGGGGSVLAALVVGAVMWQLTGGSRRRKTQWTAMAVGLVWTANVVRLALLAVAASVLGPQTMLRDIHPWLGTLTLVVALSAATALIPRFGLTGRRASTPVQPFRALSRPDFSIVALVLSGTLLVAGPAHAATVGWDLTTGASRQGSPSASGAVDDLASARQLDDVAWAGEYLGPGSSWKRWLLFDATGRAPVAVDVTTAADASRFDQYGIAACLGFHGAVILERDLVGLPGGRRAERITYRPDDRPITSVLSWRQRVGDKTERVVLHRAVLDGESYAQSTEPLQLLATEILMGVDHAVVA